MGKGRISQIVSMDESFNCPCSITAAKKLHLVLGGPVLTGISIKVTDDVTGNKWVFHGYSHGAISLPLQSSVHADRL